MPAQIGRYQIKGVLGRGGMGEVLRGYDPKLDRDVAIKQARMPDGASGDEKQAWFEKRLFKEARAVAKLRHPGIVAVYDFFEEGGVGYIIMEFVSGCQLSAMVTPDPALVLRIIREAAAALDHAHANHVVHCDIKPANIMIEDSGAVRIADFGIAKLLDAETTQTMNPPGTMYYMAPERISAQAVDGRADQYALAVVAYDMLTASKLYDADNLARLAFQIAMTPPEPASKRNSKLPVAIDAVLAQALAKSAADRFKTCSEFAAALESAFRDPPTRRTVVTPVLGATKEVHGLTYVWIPPGTFKMGAPPEDGEAYPDEKPQHEVSITRGFWIGQTPVTQAAYERVIGENPSHFNGANLPVESISWDDAQEYCQAVGMRLPTEAEWEYAARAGSTASRYGDLDKIAWHSRNSESTTRDVGLLEPNAWGLYDMLGNVWEWTADWYDEKYYAQQIAQDPQGPPKGTQRTLRAGSWGYFPRDARVSCRLRGGPKVRGNVVGLRCVGN